MDTDREERMEMMITAIYDFIYVGKDGMPPATVRFASLESFKKLTCWVSGSFFAIVILGGGLKLCFMLFGGD